MGLIGEILALLFGGGRNPLKDVVEVFRENAEAAGLREAEGRGAALAQFGREFEPARPGWFDRFIDGLNRVPRPALALGTLGLFVAALADPVWFAARMQGLALVPEPLWWLMGAIVGFYFGARNQAKSQDFARSLALTLANTRTVTANIAALKALEVPAAAGGNAALDDWRAGRDG